jgi:ribonuclease VapC
MFIDASALVALFSAEAEQGRVDAVIRSTSGAFTSPLAVLETALALSRAEKWNAPVDAVTASIVELLADIGVAIRDADNPLEVTLLAGGAAARFRAGRRGLNLADCMHYAFARYFDVPMLATANEFRQTDLTVVP